MRVFAEGFFLAAPSLWNCKVVHVVGTKRAARTRVCDVGPSIFSSFTVARIEKELTEGLATNGVKARVSGREKRAYSIFRKMERKAVSFE